MGESQIAARIVRLMLTMGLSEILHLHARAGQSDVQRTHLNLQCLQKVLDLQILAVTIGISLQC